MTHQYTSIEELLDTSQQWEVAFPMDENTCSLKYSINDNRCIGAIVRRYTKSEARFILRGDLRSRDDLAFCLSAAEKSARQMGCNILSTQERVDPKWLDAMATFQIQGFKVADESWVFTGPFRSFSDRIERIESLLHQKRLVPKEARVSSLSEGLQPARALLNETLIMDDFEFDNRLRGGVSKPISTIYSQIAWYGHQIVGVLLIATTPDKTLFDIPVRYVHPDFRQSWVNALLIAASVKHGEKIGAQLIQFEANTKSHTETLALAEKTGCKRVAVFNRFQKLLSV